MIKQMLLVIMLFITGCMGYEEEPCSACPVQQTSFETCLDRCWDLTKEDRSKEIEGKFLDEKNRCWERYQRQIENYPEFEDLEHEYNDCVRKIEQFLPGISIRTDLEYETICFDKCRCGGD